MLTPTYLPPTLPPPADLETRAILKALAEANKYLGELKGRAAANPEPGILIDTLSLQEAKGQFGNREHRHHAGRVVPARPRSGCTGVAGSEGGGALSRCAPPRFQGMSDASGLITNNLIITMFQRLKATAAAFAKRPAPPEERGDGRSRLYPRPRPDPRSWST